MCRARASREAAALEPSKHMKAATAFISWMKTFVSDFPDVVAVFASEVKIGVILIVDVCCYRYCLTFSMTCVTMVTLLLACPRPPLFIWTSQVNMLMDGHLRLVFWCGDADSALVVCH